MLTPFKLVAFTASTLLLASAAMSQQTEHGGKPMTVQRQVINAIKKALNSKH